MATPRKDDSSSTIRKKHEMRCIASLVILMTVAFFLWGTLQPHDVDTFSLTNQKALELVFDTAIAAPQQDMECTWYGDCIVYKKGSNRSAFLLAPLPTMDRDRKQREWDQAWKLAQVMLEEERAQHVYFGPPAQMQLNLQPTSSFTSTTNRATNQPILFQANTSNKFLVQPIHMPPTRHVTFSLATPLQTIRNLALQALHPSDFFEKVSAEVDRSLRLLEKGMLCTRDFHVVVDEQGNFYHSQLARCFVEDPRSKDTDAKVIFAYLKSLKETAMHAARDQQDEVRLTTSSIMPRIDTQSSRYCGWFKCFFASKDVSTSGYLLVSAANEEEYQRVLQSWKTLQKLARDYGALHLMRGSPYRIAIPQEFAVRLKQVPLATENGGRINHFHPLIVQHVWKAPPHQVIKFYQPFRAKFGQDTNATVIIDTLFDGAIVSFPFVAARVAQQVQLTKQMIRDRALCVYDFQVMLDFTGNFYHFDVDRCFETIPKEYGSSSYDHANSLLEFLDQLEQRAEQLV